MSEQEDVCARFGVPFSPPSSSSIAGIALDTLDGRLPINALRHPPAGDTCGWYVWAGEDFPLADDAFRPVHLFHLEERCPAIVPYLGLAPGWRVLIAPAYEDVWLDESLFDV